MSDIILAFVLGVIAGIGYMYLRYRNTLIKHIKELEQIRLNQAKIDGQMKILNIINGIEDKECT